MIGTLLEAQTFLDELVEKYYSEEEYDLELEVVGADLLELNCSTDYREFESETIHLPISEGDFEEEVARLADTAQWALSPVIDPTDIEIEGL